MGRSISIPKATALPEDELHRLASRAADRLGELAIDCVRLNGSSRKR